MSEVALIVSFADADHSHVDRLGGKGAGLVLMTSHGLAVPDGFIVTTEACRQLMEKGKVPADLPSLIEAEVEALADRTNLSFGGGPSPLLVSVRSGSPISMPGMMDTVLNLGLNRAAATALSRQSGDLTFLYDLLRRFHRMYGEIVLGALDGIVDEALESHAFDASGDPGRLFDEVWARCSRALEADTGSTVPIEPRQQLERAVEAVLRSWDNPRARLYRDHNGIDSDLGTAVVVQRMVFGNRGPRSGTGVAFSRNPITGENELYGEYLERGQGEDVVAGVSDPVPLGDAMGRRPSVFESFPATCRQLEDLYGDAVDIEFTVEDDLLYLLQVRNAKRTPEAAVRIAAEVAAASGHDPGRALDHVRSNHVRQSERPRFDDDELKAARDDGRLLGVGVGASPGQVSGTLVFNPDRAVELAERGATIILARETTSPQDLHGMLASVGIVTARGGATSHAAVVARALAKPCIVGCSTLTIDGSALSGPRHRLVEGDVVSIDGATGEVLAGPILTTAAATTDRHLDDLLASMDRRSGCRVFGKATTAQQVRRVRAGGAGGIVTTVDDVLATRGVLHDVVGILNTSSGGRDLRLIADLVSNSLVPILAGAENLPMAIRGLDFVADEAREYLGQTQLLEQLPALSLPLGWPELVEAQLAGIVAAAEQASFAAPLSFVLRHLPDPAEAKLLDQLTQRSTGGVVSVGGYGTSPRSAINARSIASPTRTTWFEASALQANVFGLPLRQLLTAEPLDGYVQAGLLTVDPREQLDSATLRLFREIMPAIESHGPDCIGVRLAPDTTDRVSTQLYDLGFRLFAVDQDEIRATRLTVGRAALARWPRRNLSRM